MARDKLFNWPKKRLPAPTRATPSADPTQQSEPQARVLEFFFAAGSLLGFE